MVQISSVEKYMGMNYPIEIKTIRDEGETFYEFAYPDLPGLTIYVDTIDEGIEEIRNVKKGWFATAIKHGLEIPTPYSKANERV